MNRAASDPEILARALRACGFETHTSDGFRVHVSRADDGYPGAAPYDGEWLGIGCVLLGCERDSCGETCAHEHVTLSSGFFYETDDARVALWAVKGACAALSIGITPRDDDAGDPRRPEVQP